MAPQVLRLRSSRLNPTIHRQHPPLQHIATIHHRYHKRIHQLRISYPSTAVTSLFFTPHLRSNPLGSHRHHHSPPSFEPVGFSPSPSLAHHHSRCHPHFHSHLRSNPLGSHCRFIYFSVAAPSAGTSPSIKFHSPRRKNIYKKSFPGRGPKSIKFPLTATNLPQ